MIFFSLGFEGRGGGGGGGGVSFYKDKITPIKFRNHYCSNGMGTTNNERKKKVLQCQTKVTAVSSWKFRVERKKEKETGGGVKYLDREK